MDQKADNASRRFVRQAAPDADYLAPLEPRGNGRLLLAGAGWEAEALQWDGNGSAHPESPVLSREDERRGVLTTWTLEDYVAPTARAAARRPSGRGPATRLATTFVPQPGWDLVTEGEDDAWELAEDWEEEPEDCGVECDWRTESDEYDALEARHGGVDDVLDDRPVWERGLDDEEDESDLAAPHPEPVVAEGTQLIASVPVLRCANPHGCSDLLKAKGRCSACLVYASRHHGEDRPAKLLNRSRQRQNGF